MKQTRRGGAAALIKPGWVALVEIVRRLEEQPYHPPVVRSTFARLAYIATEKGIPTGLDLRQGCFGPSASDAKRVLARLVNNGLIAERRLGRMFEVRVGPTFEDARRAYLQDLASWDAAIDKVADLFMRMDTHQAELAATVLYAARDLEKRGNGAHRERDVLRRVLEWKRRRRPRLEEQEVASTIRNLAALGWLEVQASNDLPVSEDALVGDV
jgi:hypothetical protein